MEPVRLTDPASGSTASIAVAHGFNCFEFRAAVGEGVVVDVLDSAPGFADTGDKPSHNGIPLLFPFPNRIRGGRFSWDGRDYHLPEDRVAYDGAGNAIHGFVLDRPWRVSERTGNSVTGEFRLSVDAPKRFELWPADFILRLRYTLAGAALGKRTSKSQIPIHDHSRGASALIRISSCRSEQIVSRHVALFRRPLTNNGNCRTACPREFETPFPRKPICAKARTTTC